MASKASKIREWSSRFLRFQKSNTTVTRFCRAERVTVQAFYYWRDRVPQSIWLGSDDGYAVPVSAAAVGQCFASNQTDVPSSNGPVVRFTIQAASVTVQCESTSLQAIELLLRWAADNKALSTAASFKQLV
jgi:hypothetical protein